MTFIESKPAYEAKSYKNVTKDAIISAVKPELKKSKKGNEYWQFRVEVNINEEIAGKNPATLSTPFMFLTNRIIDPSMEKNILYSMRVKKEKNGDKEGYTLEQMKKLEGKQCIVLLYDSYYLSKPNEDGKQFVNTYPKVFGVFHTDFPFEKMEAYNNDALLLSEKEKFEAENKLHSQQALPTSFQTESTENTSSDDLPW
jgi:hypothetical protein